jgi:hypothetical protein
MITSNAPLRNDQIASRLLAVIAMTNPAKLQASIEAELDHNYRNRRARSAARNGNGSARTGDRETSVMAASKVNVSRQKRSILRVLAEAGEFAMCADEISLNSGVPLNSASTRMKELVTDLKFVHEFGKVLFAGSYKLAYTLTPAGRQWLEANHVANA